MSELQFDRSYYERSYRSYERQNPRHKLAFYRRLLERAVAGAGVESPRVLEIGCAFGGVLGALDPRWARFGVDVSDYAIERARRAIPGVAFAAAPATKVPFAPPFHAVAAFDVLEHVEPLDELRARLRALVAPKGALVFVVPVYDGPTGPVIRWLDRDPTHVHKRSRDAWLDWTREAFDVEAWWGVYRYLLPGGHYIHRPTRRLRRFTPAVAVVARQRA